jgi:ketosteroid isomerase-like protein
MNFGPANIDHPDALTYRRAADAFRHKDLETVAQTIHEDVTWHFSGSTWLAREIHGRDALIAYLKEVMTRTAGTFILEDRFISGTDHHLVAIQCLGATHNGRTEKFDAVSVMRFEGRRQIERWIHVLDPEAFDAFFAKFE